MQDLTQPLKRRSLIWSAPMENPVETQQNVFPWAYLTLSPLLAHSMLPNNHYISSLALSTHGTIFARYTWGGALTSLSSEVLFDLMSSMDLRVCLKSDPVSLGLSRISDHIVCPCWQIRLADSPWTQSWMFAEEWDSFCWNYTFLGVSDCSVVGGMPGLLQSPG